MSGPRRSDSEVALEVLEEIRAHVMDMPSAHDTEDRLGRIEADIGEVKVEQLRLRDDIKAAHRRVDEATASAGAASAEPHIVIQVLSLRIVQFVIVAAVAGVFIYLQIANWDQITSFVDRTMGSVHIGGPAAPVETVTVPQ